MESKFPQSLMPRTPAPDVFHILNNQLQILLVSTEKLDNLTTHDQEARKECSAIRMSARKIAEVVALLAKNKNNHPLPAGQQQWPRLQTLLNEENQEAEM
jgi:hypothetical protein